MDVKMMVEALKQKHKKVPTLMAVFITFRCQCKAQQLVDHTSATSPSSPSTL